jgi:6-pyruvoyltetrahydropterin/6-carboxytetrahydropterin synthase
VTVHLSRRYGFFASHRLHEPSLTDEQNRALYGKCNNPFGHGHNYEVEVTIRGRVDRITGRAVDLRQLDELCERVIVAPYRYRNLNLEMAANPTTENLALVVEQNLRSAWSDWFDGEFPKLEKIRIWETERNICEVETKDEA